MKYSILCPDTTLGRRVRTDDEKAPKVALDTTEKLIERFGFVRLQAHERKVRKPLRRGDRAQFRPRARHDDWRSIRKEPESVAAAQTGGVQGPRRTAPPTLQPGANAPVGWGCGPASDPAHGDSLPASLTRADSRPIPAASLTRASIPGPRAGRPHPEALG